MCWMFSGVASKLFLKLLVTIQVAPIIIIIIIIINGSNKRSCREI